MNAVVQSFQQKLLRVTFTLGSGSFGGGGSQLQLSGLRIVAFISGSYNFLTQLDLKVYGMQRQYMNALSVIQGVQGFPTSIGQNYVLLEGNQGGGWYTVFAGIIVAGGPEYRGMPETFFRCQALPAPYFQGQQPGKPAYQSLPNGASVDSIAQNIANSIGIPYINYGVTATVPKGTYLPGTPIDQLKAMVAKSGNAFVWIIDHSTNPNTLVIVASNQPRQQGRQLVLSPSSGLVGYPTIEEFGIGVVAFFDPGLLLANPFVITGSEIPAANGTWMPYDMQIVLESLNLGGSQWLASMRCQQVYS